MQRPITHCIPIPHCILLVQPKLSIDYDRINKTLVPFHPCSLYNKPGDGSGTQWPFTHRIPIPQCILLVQPKLSIDYDRINKTLVPFHPCSLYNKPGVGRVQRPITHCIPIPHCILLVQPKLSIDYDRINKTLVPFHSCSLSNLCDSVYHRGILNRYCYHYPTSVIASWWGPKAFLSDSVWSQLKFNFTTSFCCYSATFVYVAAFVYATLLLAHLSIKSA